MSSLKRITALSDEVSKNSKLLTEYLASKGLEAASFDVDGLDEYPINPNDEEPFKARLDLIAATKELHDLSLGPKESLRYLAWDVSTYPASGVSHLTNALSLSTNSPFKPYTSSKSLKQSLCLAQSPTMISLKKSTFQC